MYLTIIGIVLLILFIVIALGYNTVLAKTIDEWAANRLEGNEFLEGFHIIGNTETIIFITYVFALFLVIDKKAWQSALFSIVSIHLGNGLNRFLKRVFERPRPDVVDQLTSYSFPSGHAMGTTICLLTIVFVIQQQYFKGRSFYVAYTVAFVLSMLVALSRVAGARHFFTDIIAGVSLGIVFVIMMAFIYKKLTR